MSITNDQLWQVVNALFQKFDVDKNGFLQRGEIVKCCADIFKSVGIQNINEGHVSDFMKEVDTNKDQKISKD